MRAKDFATTILKTEQTLLEVDMSPSNLRQLAAKTNALVGIEFEMVVPDINMDDEESDGEPDYSYDRGVSSIDNIIDFYNTNDYNSRRSIASLRTLLEEAYKTWRHKKIAALWKNEGKKYIALWAKENLNPETIEKYAGKKNDYKKFAEIAWEKEDAAYDKALETFIELQADSISSDQETFLTETGITEMSDVLNNDLTSGSDVVWPYMSESESGTQDLATLASDFSEAIGRKVFHSDEYHGGERESDAYTIEPDTSIHAGSGDAGLEFISPPLPVQGMIDDLAKVKRWAKGIGATTNGSTGLHINISIPDFNRANLDYVKLVLLSGDEHVLKQFQRLSNTYAENALAQIKNKASYLDPDEIQKIWEVTRHNIEDIASKIIHSGRTAKYTSVNVKDNWVEFRGAGGDWLRQDLSLIENTVLRYVVALDAACDPKKYREEYLKKLHQLIDPKGKSPELGMLAKVMSGEIHKSEYGAKVLGDRYERLAKLGIKAVGPHESKAGNWKIEFLAPDGQQGKVLYLVHSPQVSNGGKALSAAMQYDPLVFNKRSVQNITVTQVPSRQASVDIGDKDYYGYPSWKVINNATGASFNVYAATSGDAIQKAMQLNPELADDRNRLTAIRQPLNMNEDWQSTAKGLGMAAAVALGSHAIPDRPAEPTPSASSIISRPTPVDKSIIQRVMSGLMSPAGMALRKEAKLAGIRGIQLAQFLGQCAHETQDFVTLKEFGGKLDFEKYDPKFNPEKAKLLGNTHPGDGVRYHGRGFIQLTGRENYRKVGNAIGLPLEEKPELAERPDVAAKVAVWYWQNRVAPRVKNFSDTQASTRPINAGLHGIEDRVIKFNAIMQIIQQNNNQHHNMD